MVVSTEVTSELLRVLNFEGFNFHGFHGYLPSTKI